ncbi:response regulator transcription factor [Oleiagrimonas sp. C23AA]|uniref:response regulator transcription factor n=1 Tax=Oleiagrimonas sp. C23AA TaxID=2719047 RepID=UPI00141E422D|nr:response regulator transcription factor [Oleiagrimonas sp. C23AA]NII11097.1 response regulator transcription factor [Oleiagrimonas sp. C23AA]
MRKDPDSVPLIVVVDDETDVITMIDSYFSTRQMNVLGGANSRDLHRILRDEHPDLILLDLGLGSENGIDLALDIRKNSSLPLIIISGRDTTADKVVALELGADDYVTKPFELAELYARVRTVLRRVRPHVADVVAVTLEFDQFVFQPDRRRLMNADGLEVALTSGELHLLELLLSHPHRILSRDQLLEWLHGRDAGPFDRSVDMQITRLRRKLGDDPAQPRLIKTVRGSGYWFAPTVKRSP